MKQKKASKRKLKIDFHLVLIIASTIVPLVVFILYPLSSETLTDQYRPLMNESVERVHNGLEKESRRIESIATDLASEHQLDYLIKKDDPYSLISFTRTQSSEKNITILQVTDKEGTVLARIKNLARRGDNVFLTSPWGQTIAQGQAITTFATNNYKQSRLISAAPVISNDGVMVGAVVAGNDLDDAFSRKFRTTYLSPGTEIAFYNDEMGIQGSSFEDEDTKRILKENLGDRSFVSDSKVQNSSLLHIKINGKYYLMKSLPLPANEYNHAGVIIFIPQHHGTEIIIVTALITLLLFAIHILFDRYYKRKLTTREEIARPVISILFFSLSFLIILHRFDTKHFEFKSQPYPLYNSVLSLSPDAAFFDPNYEQEISLVLSSGGEPVNAVEADLNFDPQGLEIISVDTSNSICPSEMFLDKKIDNVAGNLSIACIVPSPGFAESQGTVANIKIRPLKAGSYTLEFTPETRVLANDGLATNVLRRSDPGYYQVIDNNTLNEHPQLDVYSFTHPNTDQWYKKLSVTFSWLNSNHDVLAYALNQDPFFTPSESTTTAQSITVAAKKSGVYYFHIRNISRDGDPITHRKVLFDNQPPQNLKINTSLVTAHPGEIIRIEPEAEDLESGLEKNYYVKTQAGLYQPASGPLFLSFPKKGIYPVSIRVFDRAGNFSEETTSLLIK